MNINLEEKIIYFCVIFAIFVSIFTVIYLGYYSFFTGETIIIKGEITNACFTNHSINISMVEHWWITIELNDGIPQFYYFKDDNVFNNNGKQKMMAAWSKIEPLIGEEVILKYYIEYEGNQLKYFKDIEIGN